MNEHKLIASAALFRELYNNDNDIYDVISEFIRATIRLDSLWGFDTTKCNQSLEGNFGFKIPDAVVKTCLRKRMRNEVTLNNGKFNVTDNFDKESNLEIQFQESDQSYKLIVSLLQDHIRKLINETVEIEPLKNSFNNYLLRQKSDDSYAKYIAHFLLKHENDPNIKKKLNQIEEGLVVYEGIKYTSDISQIGSWKGQLIIFLDTEHLFNALGYNGELYKRIFGDFYNLVKEANRSSKGRIELKYSSKIKNEVDNFFYAAEKILESSKVVDPSKPAMVEIVNGSANRSEIVEKKARFITDLDRMNIKEQPEIDIYQDDGRYIVAGQDDINKLHEEFRSYYSVDEISDVLTEFNEINCYRTDKKAWAFENTKAILLTEMTLKRKIALSKIIRDKDEIPYSTTIEFITERLWFKLNKGFNQSSSVPVTFDVITKAKLVLASQVNNRVSENYKNLNSKLLSGELTTDTAALMLADLRKNVSRPEDISDKFDASLDFLSNDAYESVLRDRSILQQKVEEGEKAKEELDDIKIQAKSYLRDQIKQRARTRYRISVCMHYLIAPLIFALILFLFYNSTKDSVLDIIWGLFAIVSIIFPFFLKKSHHISSLRYARKFYKKEIVRIGLINIKI